MGLEMPIIVVFAVKSIFEFTPPEQAELAFRIWAVEELVVLQLVSMNAVLMTNHIFWI